jgi:hypothetical protein
MKRIMVNIDDKLAERLSAEAKKEKRSASNMAVVLIEEGLDRRKKS